jgi:protein-S-isoprenylcysteine O-methyltransferase Ste14
MRRVTAAVGSVVFFAVGPGIVVGLIPWLLTGWQVRDPLPPYWAPMRVLGVILLLAGLIVLVQAFVRFVVEGLGTPAPIAAPERLVVGGLYRYIRTPMYVAILAAIVGQALLLGQLGLLLYTAALWLISAAFARRYEEPTLKRRFGADYEAYRREVTGSSEPLPPFDNPSWKALQARTAHLMREGYFTTPLRAARSSSSGNSFLPTICSLNVSISASASFRLLPDSRSVIIEAEAWEMAQPRPLNLTSATLSPSKAA